MKKLVCIFAHPDDEAFGPGGAIAIFAKTAEVSIICVTNGDAGQCSIEDERELKEIRREEIERSAKILGVKNVYFLDYKDGCLCNGLYHEIAEKIKEKLEELQPDTLLTFEYRGVSGHIDHVTVSMITNFVFEKLSFIHSLYMYCISDKARELNKDYFIYFPPGYKKEDVDEVIDTSEIWDTKVKAMHEHKSQIHDVNRILERQKNLPKEEYFLVKRK